MESSAVLAGQVRQLEDRITLASSRARFATAVDQLSPRQRTIVIMFEVDGYSGAEIAAMLGISADTVRWHLHHARAAAHAHPRRHA